MLASAGRSRSGDRFYNPPAVRRQLQLQQQQQQQQQQEEQRPVLSDDKTKLDKDKQIHEQQQRLHRPLRIQRTKSSAESDDCASSTSAAATPPASISSRSGVNLPNLTNLDRFLESTTPLVPGQHFSKPGMTDWRTREDEFQPYFVLDDLWESFKEWSTFGAGVPLLLNGSDSVVQYYVPYLSGIQLYIDPNIHNSRTRKPGQESDTDSSRVSHNGSSDYDTERGLQPFLQGVRSQQDLVEASRQGIKGLSISNKIINGSSSYEGEIESSQSVLAFEYFAHDPPFCREPLADKISFLASRFPQLMTYRSCDLSPASWVSVAWYPIYRIPIGPTLQNLDSCFLAFHSLSKPVCAQSGDRQCLDMASKLSLPIFGLASYKFKTAVWDHSGADASEKASLLWQAADDWLQKLNVELPDYRFFSTHNFYPR